MIDVIMGYSGRATEEQILKMHEGKTARYTFEGPAHLGCLLAGGDEEILKSFSDYALPLGKAFQIRDDVLGVFGDEKKLGKPVGSDITEGKQTLLVLKALESGDKNQKELIKRYLGRKNLTEKEIEGFRQVVRETGSLDYSQKLAEKFVSESLDSLSKIDFKNEEAKTFFKGIAEYMVKREI
jgi:geranylgeranyl diphosphate synthase, type I